ncbi:MAG: alpha/beta hydrolase [Bacteroidota bacterium]
MKIIFNLLTLIIVSTTANAQVQDYLTDPQLDRGTKEFLEALNSGDGPPLETLSKEDARQVLIGAQEAVEVDLSGIEESEKTITADGHTIKLNIVRPEGAKEKLPVFIFVHGGGWILGDYPTHKRMVRELVVRTGAVGVFVNYSPSPEKQFPTAINEIYAATKWVADNGDEINVDGSQLGIIGNSVGGNMSTVTTLKAKADGRSDMIKVQVLLWPVTDSSFEQASYQAFGEDRFLTTSIIKWMWDQYTTDPTERQSIYAAPLRASIEELRGLPPAFIHVAESDILRDEAEAYGRKLDEAGVPTATVRYNGMIHDWGLLHFLKDLPSTVSVFDNAANELKKYLF